MTGLSRYAGMYRLFLAQHFKTLLEYRVNFAIGAASTIIMQTAGLLTIWVVMSQIPSLNGWSLSEVLLIYGLLTLCRSIEHTFADNLWTIGRYVRQGTFDRLLVRPLDPLFQLIADRFNQDGVGNFLVGLVITLYALSTLNIGWTPLKILYLPIAVASGTGIFLALNLLTCVSAFWLIDSTPVTRAVHDMHQFARYPLSIYPRAIGIFLTWLIPYGFASFYPANYILGRDLGIVPWLAPPIALILCVIAYRIWRFGLRHYTSTGS